MKNACCKLLAVRNGAMKTIAPFLTVLLSLHPSKHYSSVICHTHTHKHWHFFSRGSSTAWHCLVNLLKLYGTDTQLVVGALTSREKKRLGLLYSGALNRDRNCFTGLQRLSYSQTKQLICQGDPQCPPPSLWFVHGSICLQSRRVLKMRVSKTRSPAWDQAITHLTTVWPLFCVDFHCKSNGPKQK